MGAGTRATVAIGLLALIASGGCTAPRSPAAGSAGGAPGLSASGSVGSGPVGHGAGQGATVPGVEAAQASALTEFGLLAGGDYGGAWDLWTERAQRAVSRSDFVRFQDTCPTALGVPVRVVSAQPADSAGVDRTRDVVLTWQRGSVTGTARMMYADGSWRYEPDQATLNGYSRGCPPSA